MAMTKMLTETYIVQGARERKAGLFNPAPRPHLTAARLATISGSQT
jgi:hypothetical protein